MRTSLPFLRSKRIAVEYFDGGRVFTALLRCGNGLRPKRAKAQQQEDKQKQ
jgi:hypothetical protein